MSSLSPKRMSRSSESQPKCTLQRLLIVHYQLPVLCTGGELDEGASLEELSEQILYYHDATTSDSDNSTVNADRSYISKDAVQFSGLCSALLSLPNSFHEGDVTNDVTRVVHMTNASLVFVPIESENRNIFAVAQVERSHATSSTNRGVTGGNPLAIEHSIKKCHNLFCLLRGSIHCRLSAANVARRLDELKNESYKEHCSIPTQRPIDRSVVEGIDNGRGSDLPSRYSPEAALSAHKSDYPEMDRLYALRKEVRCRQQKLAKRPPSLESKRNFITNEIADLEREIQHLAAALPIFSIRSHLRTHYDAYLAEAGLIAGSTGAYYRCLIETVPSPITMPSESIDINCPPSSPSAVACLQLGKTLKTLLSDSKSLCHKQQNDAMLLGISSFFNGHLIFSHVRSTCMDGVKEHPMQRIALSHETAHVLLEYMASYRHKIYHQSMHHATIQDSSTSRFNRRLFRTSFGKRPEESSFAASESGLTDETLSISTGRYLTSPPLSMLHASDRVLNVEVPSHGIVWTPLVYLPLEHCDENPKGCRYVKGNIVLYECDSYTFLLYVLPESPGGTLNSTDAAYEATSLSERGDANSDAGSDDESRCPSSDARCLSSDDTAFSSPYPILLESVAQSISGAIKSIRNDEGSLESIEQDGVENRWLRTSEKPSGYAWKEPGQDIIYVDRFAQKLVLLSDRIPTNGIGDKKSIRLTLRTKKEQSSTSFDTSSGLDCRHLLASHLPLDVVIAFDDMMNETHSRRVGQSRGGVFEQCTYLPQGWMYSHTHNSHELYVHFNPNKYVTISDVQNAANRIRKKMFKECMHS